MRGLRSVLIAGVWLLRTLSAWAEGPVALRFGDHDGFGRLVFDVENGAAVQVSQSGTVVSVGLPGGSLHPVGKLPRNVAGISYQDSLVRITLPEGVTMRRSVINHHLVLDLPDPPKTVNKPGAAGVAPSPPIKPDKSNPVPPAAARPAPPTPRPMPMAEAAHDRPPSPTAAVAPQSEPPPVSAVPPPPAPEPLQGGIAAALGAVAEAGPGHQLVLPFNPQTGAAAFRQGNEGWVVFDERRPIDLAPVRQDPVFGAASVQELPGATLLRVPLPNNTELRLEHRRNTWLITAIGGDAQPTPLQPILPESTATTMLFAARQPGQVVSVPDPGTGGVLLVGTQREAGQGVPLGRLAPDVSVRSSWQGLVVAPVSDVVAMRANQAGFELYAGQSGTSLSHAPPDPQTKAAAASSQLSRILDLPQADLPGLFRRLQSAIRSAADAAPQSKAESRRAVAEAMLALGMGAEAQAVLDFAAGSDVRLADAPESRMANAVAALLADRPDDASALDDSRLNGSDEAEFWRAVRLAEQQPQSPRAAQGFAATYGMFDLYPATLRERLLPIVAETLAAGGQAAAARVLCDRFKDSKTLDLARAMLAQQAGDTKEALTRLEALQASPDRLLRLRASRMAAELALADSKATPAETAHKLGKLLFAWRGDGREVDLRLRVAQLEGQAGNWRAALQLLRETEAQWPDRADQLHARLVATFAAALQSVSQGALKPFDAVALAAENADLMPQGEAGLTLARRLSDQLLALDLPDRAVGVLEKMVQSTPPSAARASFGGQLAELRLQTGDAAGAVQALADTSLDSLPPDVLERRGIAFAEAVAAQGDFASARATLQQLDSEAADRALASLAETGGHWPEARDALAQLAARVVPRTGGVDAPGAQILLRLAAAASQARDQKTLDYLRSDALPRLPKGAESDMLDFLTSGQQASPDQMAALRRGMMGSGSGGGGS